MGHGKGRFTDCGGFVLTIAWPFHCFFLGVFSLCLFSHQDILNKRLSLSFCHNLICVRYIFLNLNITFFKIRSGMNAISSSVTGVGE